MTAESDFASHGQLWADRSVRQGGNQGSNHGDAGRRSVFWNGTRRNVDMDIDVFIEIVIESQLNGIRGDPGEGGLDGLRHHVSHLAGDLKMKTAYCNVG